MLAAHGVLPAKMAPELLHGYFLILDLRHWLS
jgi:hypothetical protein